MFSLKLQESSISILRDLKFGLIYLILNQPNVCFCCRYIMSKGKLKKTAFPIHPNLPGPGVSSSSRDARSKGANWSRLMEKYNLDMLKSHIMKATRKASINEYRKLEYFRFFRLFVLLRYFLCHFLSSYGTVQFCLVTTVIFDIFIVKRINGNLYLSFYYFLSTGNQQTYYRQHSRVMVVVRVQVSLDIGAVPRKRESEGNNGSVPRSRVSPKPETVHRYQQTHSCPTGHVKILFSSYKLHECLCSDRRCLLRRRHSSVSLARAGVAEGTTAPGWTS